MCHSRKGKTIAMIQQSSLGAWGGGDVEKVKTGHFSVVTLFY